MQIAIVEDNLSEAEELREKVVSFFHDELSLTKVKIFASAKQFLSTNEYFDLLLIDCLLPGISGVELAKEVRKTNSTTAFIFTTAYMDYAVDGYETNAMRYLLKPIEDKKLQEALLSFLQSNQSAEVVELTGTTRYADFAKKNDILYVEYVGRKVVVRVVDRSIESHLSIKDFEKKLGSELFYRTSQRFLVNFNFIAKKENNILTMRNGEKVIISGRKLNAFNRAYLEFLKRS